MRTRKRIRNLLAVGFLAGAAALTAAAPAQSAPRFDCMTEIQNGGETGAGRCTNLGDGVGEFRVHVVCGLAMDQYSSWVLVMPGERAQTSANCPFTLPGQGVGRVTVEFR
ncbi:hypothetical protein [Streptomyces cavernicola]|uniref:Uncharacterized protein n=1 Tax=Streptomyces cavernicola TaxID=3043613 RepID=A0ABT6SE53_9ACTN|nr:hypothetical protein [Streptomyces sp. B-S-A6]MDI3406209.1 hypothetical protein [Streptomyces sp. B-S-A6]